MFTTRFLHGPNNLEREVVILGIEQKNGRPNHPQTRGKVCEDSGPVLHRVGLTPAKV